MDWIRIRMDPELMPGSRSGTRKIQTRSGSRLNHFGSIILVQGVCYGGDKVEGRTEEKTCVYSLRFVFFAFYLFRIQSGRTQRSHITPWGGMKLTKPTNHKKGRKARDTLPIRRNNLNEKLYRHGHGSYVKIKQTATISVFYHSKWCFFYIKHIFVVLKTVTRASSY